MAGPQGASDVVIVGGGIAGSAMAIVLARRGVRVTVLERQPVYRDRVRGEYLAHWGVAEADRLGLRGILESAGGFFPRRSVPYDEIRSPEEAEAAAKGVAVEDLGIPGPMMVGHPAACAALSSAAEAVGAAVVSDVGHVHTTFAGHPEVSYEIGGSERRLRCALVIGADGRNSSVRQHAAISLQRARPAHLVSGLLVDGVAEWPQDAVTVGTEGDVMFFIFPQGGQRLRLYLCTACEQRERFAGAGGTASFLDAFRRLTCLPYGPALADSTPVGPCATYGAEDTWTDRPFARGVALIGDAAGYNNPIIGQGLAIALRDVRVLSELLLGGGNWSPELLQPYAEERSERMRRLRFAAALVAALMSEFGPAPMERRRRHVARMAAGDGPNYGMALKAGSLGPERIAASAFTDEARRRVLE